VLNAKTSVGTAFQARTLPANYNESSALSQCTFRDAIIGGGPEFIAASAEPLGKGSNMGPRSPCDFHGERNALLEVDRNVGERERARDNHGYSLGAESQNGPLRRRCRTGKAGSRNRTGRRSQWALPGTSWSRPRAGSCRRGITRMVPGRLTFGPGGNKCPGHRRLLSSWKAAGGKRGDRRVPAGVHGHAQMPPRPNCRGSDAAQAV